MNQPLFGDKNVGLFGFGERGEEGERGGEDAGGREWG